ncbi:signal peptidase I [Enterococcus pallens]|uniref:Signal peptidase I n=1 Tax=Enterococcus pallens ATCC BAA-351 TaxID=1158607 RepID=R2S672_9ENTE|nr:signal peptidase I [Enterococcus pallens]EOH90970.1 signal peptidase I [Enterococcus pallens ATCC BAA-351]EOU16166.1 signal peptidase I [Enterococcus pallens ATCC BAA-351]
MPRQRDYHERDYEYDTSPYRGERPPSNRRPHRRNEYEEEYSEYRRPYPKRPTERMYGESRRREGQHERYKENYSPNRIPRKSQMSYGDVYDRERIPPPRSTRPPRPMTPPSSAQPLQEAKKSTNRKIFLFIYNLFFYTLTIGILLSSLMFAFSEKSDAAIFGYRFYQVLTNSMAPQPDSPSRGFYAGDIVLVKMTDGSQVKEGDIVTFQVGEGDRYLTHRMVERLDELNGEKGDYIVTKGDANNSKDPPISADRIYGKVAFVIPKMGSVLNFVQENLWLCLVCVLSTFGFFLVLKAYFLQPEPARRPNKQRNYPRGV